MGWKRIKDHYNIGHIVHVTKAGICIGSPYISDIIVIGLDGKMVKRYADRSNADLERYQREFDADPDLLCHLANEPDEHSNAIAVYTYGGGNIIEKLCDEPGWPNVTHDGALMFNNTYSSDKADGVKWAKREAALGVKYRRQNLTEAKMRLEQCREQLRSEKACLSKLKADYP
jgi:hypothetical protein